MNLKVTNTVKRTALWYSLVTLLLYLFFNAITLFEVHITLIDDLDTRLEHELEHILHTIEVDADSIKLLSRKELNELEFKEIFEKSFFLQIYNIEGNLFLVSENVPKYGNIDLGFPNSFTPYYFEDVETEKYSLRSVYKELVNPKGATIGYIQLSAVQSTFNTLFWEIIKLNLISLPIFIVLINLVSLFLAKKTFAPLNKIIQTADSISATNLSNRLTYEADPDDELGQLKNTLNSLFNRLENQVKEISQFTDNASHQLMTPLTTMKTELEYILKKDHPTKEYQETLEILKLQTDKMIMMVKSMLIMSRSERSNDNLTNVFNLSKLLMNEIKPLFNNDNIKFNIEEGIYIRGNSESFTIAVQNLISNALKYSKDIVDVTVNLFVRNNNVILQVADKGIGINQEDKDKIFQRFYRSHDDEVQSIEGYGLGLSLVQTVVKSMNGLIKVIDNQPHGTVFEITLPYLNLT